MKKTFLFPLCCISVICLLTAACKQEDRSLKKQLTFGTFQTEKNIHLFNDTTLPGCTFTLHIEYPKAFLIPEKTGGLIKDQEKMVPDTAGLYKIQELYVTTCFSEAYSALPPVQAAQKYETAYIDAYQKLETEYKNDYSKKSNPEDAVWMNYEQIVDSKTLFNNDTFYSYGVTVYSYTGGAHGMTTTIYQVIDLNQLQPLTLADIFDERNLDQVALIIRETLARDLGYNEVSKLSEIGYIVNEIRPTENFYIDDKGITWLYNQYDIAPYALGQPTVFIGYDKLKLFIKEDSPLYPMAQEE